MNLLFRFEDKRKGLIWY